MKINRIISIMLILSLLALAVGCNQDENETRNNLTIIDLLVAETLDPYAGGLTGKVVNLSIFDSLVKYDHEANIVPALAKEFIFEEDGYTITFKLEEDVKFHNGSKMTADDVIFSMDKFLSVPNNQWMLTYFASYEKVDEYTVKIVKATPYAMVLNILAERMFVVPKDLYSSDQASFATNPIGTGGYKFVKQNDDQSVELIAYDDYFMGKPEIENVLIKPPIDPSAAVIALESGEVDIIFGIPAMQKSIIEDNDKFVYVETEGWAMNTLVLMGDDASDANLRKAIRHAVNPENAILVANEGIGSVPSDVYSSKIMGDLSGSFNYEGYNIDLAKEYLDKSTYSDDMELAISVDASSSVLAESLQSDLEKAGIKVTIEQLETNALYGKLMNREIDMAILPMGTHMNGPEEMLAIPIMPTFAAGMDPSEKRVELIEAIKVESDMSKRKELVKEAIMITMEESDLVPVFEPVFNLAYSKDFTNVSPISAATNMYYLSEIKLAD